MPRMFGIHHISGLDMYSDFVTELEEAEFVRRAMVPARGHIRPSKSSGPGLERARVERYGRTVYSTGNISAVVPPYLGELCERIHAKGITTAIPNSVSINEYRPGQGLISHIDNADGGEEICILGLQGDAQMQMSLEDHDAFHDVEFTFPRRALLVMSGLARWSYSHAILPVAQTRISIVFRRCD